MLHAFSLAATQHPGLYEVVSEFYSATSEFVWENLQELPAR